MRIVDFDTEEYWAGCADRRLLIARCKDCRRWLHPPKGRCPQCWTTNIEREEVSGRARLYSFTEKPAAGGGPTTITVWAELAEQARLVVVGALIGGSERALIGAELQLAWQQTPDGWAPAFELADR
jgi:uncharacterized OB-fold protein